MKMKIKIPIIRNIRRKKKSYVTITYCEPAPEGLSPLEEWRNNMVLLFQNLREMLQEVKKTGDVDLTTMKLPHFRDRNGWKSFCFPKGDFDTQNPSFIDEKKLPFLNVIFSLDERTVNVLIGYHIDWLINGHFSLHRANWIYAFLAVLEKPLLPDIACKLRDLIVFCCKERSTIPPHQIDHPLLPSLNILTTIIDKFFGQGDKD